MNKDLALPLLSRNVPKYMQGLRIASEVGPDVYRMAHDSDKATALHPVRGGATRNDKVWLGNPLTNTVNPEASVVPPFKSPWLLLLVLGGVVLWIAR